MAAVKTFFMLAVLVFAMVAANPLPEPGGWGPKHEHIVIHVPYHVHTVHHVKKVPVYVKSYSHYSSPGWWW